MPRTKLLLEVLRCPPDHQAADEHRKQRHHHQTVEPATGRAGSDLAQHHVQHQHRTAGAGEAVVGRVRRTVGPRGRHLTEQGAAGHPEPGLGAFERCPDSVHDRAVSHRGRRHDRDHADDE